MISLLSPFQDEPASVGRENSLCAIARVYTSTCMAEKAFSLFMYKIASNSSQEQNRIGFVIKETLGNRRGGQRREHNGSQEKI